MLPMSLSKTAPVSKPTCDITSSGDIDGQVGVLQAFSLCLSRLPHIFVAFLIAIQLTLLTLQPAQAASAERTFQNPPSLESRTKPPSMFQATPTADAEQNFEFDIDYSANKLYNPATDSYDQVRLRSYIGTGIDPSTPYVAPTIEVNPGDTLRINIDNQLSDADHNCPGPLGQPNIPHCFNITNLHTHGLWISPGENDDGTQSDNVFALIHPQTSQQYKFEIRSDHPAGTFWYHPHVHGSTALQVSSGMAGALIIRGDRLPTEMANGDIDTLLNAANISGENEKVLVLQQIQYACLEDGTIKVETDDDGNVVSWICDPEDTGGIEFYSDPDNNALFGPGTWDQSGHYTSINGLILPTFHASAGDTQRWRLIHAGVHDTISLLFRKLEDDASPFKGSAAEAADYIDKNCTGIPIPYHVIADDGLTRAQVWETNLTTLQPGYRNDALVIFPERGQYCVIDTAAPPAGTVNQAKASRQLLGIVRVEGGEEIDVNDIHEHLKTQLVEAAERTMPGSIKAEIIADLAGNPTDDLKLTKFTPHDPIENGNIKGSQELAFNVDKTTNPHSFEVSNGIGDIHGVKPYDPQPFDPDQTERELTLGSVDEWTLESRFASHPFHIHVNPFQIVRIMDPNGNDVSLPNAHDGDDPQYAGLSGVWKDTLWIKGPAANNPPANDQAPPYPEGIYTVVVRTRYEEFDGEFVLHCHILDHEDQGMMQKIAIVAPED